MTVRVHGFSLHLYDDRVNNDKYYRSFIVPAADGSATLVNHWGRDGAAGQVRFERHGNSLVASAVLGRTLRAKLGKGYQLLGEGAVSVDESNLGDARKVSAKLQDWVGRPPIKMPSGYVFIIHEEEDIMDLIA